MKLSDFDYHLPEDLIAAVPAIDRTASRLLHYDRSAGNILHSQFNDIGRFLRAGDVLVLNNTRVLPARLLGRRETGGSAEALLLKQIRGALWTALLRPSGRIKKGAVLCFEKAGQVLTARVIDEAKPGSGERQVEFESEHVFEALEKVGFMPLPPYIGRQADAIDDQRYQTVYAAVPGAIAAPTAGLHFDQPLLQSLQAAGIEIVTITLHVGYGTFQPVQCEDPRQHPMHEEYYEIDSIAAERISKACREKRRVIACGTTSVRVLETAAREPGRIEASTGMTKIFIYPPYSFKITSGLITNFHLPRTTLLMLVAAFLNSADAKLLLQLYQEAVKERYRFYSYGDAMLIL